MDTDGHGTVERRISDGAAARYARTTAVASGSTVLAAVHDTPPALPVRTSPLRSQQPPLPVRDPLLRSVPPAPHRAPPNVPREVITLDQVRSRPRAVNEYVDSPQLAALRGIQNNKTNTLHLPHVATKSVHAAHGAVRTEGESPARRISPSTVDDLVISSQPQSTAANLNLKKHEKTNVIDSEEHVSRQGQCQDSIICSQCGKCRCQACTQPRELPRHWFCNNKCECSVQKMVDVCSCLCVVQACFYHCCEMESEDYSASDDPCACCERPYCCKRWTCMALCMPCLCLYWPLRCALSCCTSIYNRCSRKGCHCRRDNKLPGSKRLLIDSESSST